MIFAKKMVVPLLGVTGTKVTNSTIKQNITNANTQFESIKALYEKFKPDAMFPFMDLTVEADSLGIEINMPENDNPSVKEHSVKTLEDLEQLKKNWHGVSGRMQIFVDVMEKMVKSLPLSVMKFGYAIGPITLIGEMMGMTEMSMATIDDPELLEKFADFVVQVISEYTNALFAGGADAVCILEPAARLLSSDSYRRFSAQPFKRILQNVNNKPLILHICGNPKHLIKDMCKTGAVGLSTDTPDFPEFVKEIPEDIYLIGTLNPVKVFLNGTPESVKQETTEFLKRMQAEDIENFVLASGCELPVATPLENIEAFMEVGNMWKQGNV